MTIAQEWIEAAYARSSANDAGKLASDAELVGHVSRVLARLFVLFARARPDEAQSVLVLGVNGSPATAPIGVELIDVRRVQTAAGAKVHVIPATEQDRAWHIAPSVMRVGGTLVSRGKVGDPIAGDTLTLYVLDQPAPLVGLTSVIDPRFPQRHYQLPIDLLALYLDTKDTGREPAQHEKLVAEMGEAKAAFAAEYGLPPSALEWIHEPAERKPISAGGGA